MILDIKELEEILNEQIEVYSNIEKNILDKKQILISGDVKNLKSIDSEIEKYALMAQKLEEKRNKIASGLNYSNLTLKEIIDRIQDKQSSDNLLNLRQKLKKISENINRHNKVNAQLIEHALKMVEYSVVSIVNFLVPENSAYNNCGKLNKNKNNIEISSVNHEV